MIEPANTFEHAGVIVEIVPDDEPSATDPQDHDNAGTIYSWHFRRDFEGDEYINEPETQVYDEDAEEYRSVDLSEFFAHEYDAVLTIPLYFADYGSSGSRIYVSDDPNAAIVFTQKDLDAEFSGSADDAAKYATARIGELDQWLRGDVYGVVIREQGTDDVIESVWGFIGDPFDGYIIDEAKALAEQAATQLADEAAEAFRWACADVPTI